jgi:hypothetical protein
MRNVARLKLEEEGMRDEFRILNELRESLNVEFGADLWDDATSVEVGNETIEDIYNWRSRQKINLRY